MASVKDLDLVIPKPTYSPIYYNSKAQAWISIDKKSAQTLSKLWASKPSSDSQIQNFLKEYAEISSLRLANGDKAQFYSDLYAKSEYIDYTNYELLVKEMKRANKQKLSEVKDLSLNVMLLRNRVQELLKASSKKPKMRKFANRRRRKKRHIHKRFRVRLNQDS